MRALSPSLACGLSFRSQSCAAALAALATTVQSMQGQQKSDHHSFLELLKPLQAALDVQKYSSRSLAVGRISKALEGIAKSLEYGLSPSTASCAFSGLAGTSGRISIPHL